ncbi:MAG: hypothetical protein IKH18_08810 [Clostridia bacterium]|nr:hypothetical protein [Clostridia bacterium]
MQARFKRFTALILSVLMVLTCMPMSAMAEEAVIPTEDISVEAIPDDADAMPDEEAAPVTDADASVPSEEPVNEAAPDVEEVTEQEPSEETSAPDATQEEQMPQEEASQEETIPQAEEAQPAETPDEQPVSEGTPADEPAAEAPAEPEQETAEPVQDDRHPLQTAIDIYGHIYVATVRQTNVFSTEDLDANTLVFSTTKDVFLLMATKFTERGTVKVWFLDADGNVVTGFVSAKDLDDKYLLDEDIREVNFLPIGQGMTAIGMMSLFLVNGAYPVTKTEPQPVAEPADVPSDAEPADEPSEEQPADEPAAEPIQEEPAEVPADPADETLPETDPVEETDPAESMSADESQETEQEEPAVDAEPAEPTVEPEENPETPEELPDETEAEEQPEDQETTEEPAYAAAGSYISVTTKTRVFAGMDTQAAETYYSGEYLGNFVKDATVQILSADSDESGRAWYQVRFLYGDDFKDGTMKWTDYATCWILPEETGESAEEGCTVTDFAYTLEYLQQTRSSGRRMLKATPMNGFTLKNINGKVGGFYAWQSGLYGSSGKDSDYPQLAKSAAHGTIYATPHYLEGFTVFCLEHNLSGPGEGSGKNQSAKGPYVLVDMDTFVTNSAYGGTTGVRYKASTMHALGWVLRHTYPFMALNRSDSNNEVWSRAAGQFAMREVIKQMEGAQYVRSYWDMDNFYAFSGGAPAVYLEYARWLAANGIARARITGNITASDQSLSVSGSNYIGTVKLTTDADLIRIPKSAGTITGNSGGSDSSYYYVKSGDTIRITSTQSKFSVSMQSLSSSDEEANFLVGVPSVSIQKILVPLYGAPTPLKNGSVTFELKLGEITVTKKSDDGILLKGTVFELLNSSGSVVATATTNAKGVATFASLQPGTYTVREKTASQGYKLASASQSVSVVAGVTSTATFTNARISGRIRIIKTDKLTEKPLAGAVFTVTRLSGPESDNASDIGKVVATITTNAQGIAETGVLPWGEYKIVETGVPEGYLDSGYTTTVWIK